MVSGRWIGWSVGVAVLCTGLIQTAAGAPGGGPAHTDTEALSQARIEADLEAGSLTLQELRRLGLLVFTTPFNSADGFGDGPFDPGEQPPAAFGHRPTLGGNGTLLRVNGLDAQSCNECHTIVSHATRPPTLGFGGVGGMVQSAVIAPSLIDVADSSDDRLHYEPGHDPDLPMEFDGVADFSGRLANPPFLFGGGGVELLAKEMTADLQDRLATARAAPEGTVTPLDTHGVHFGAIVTVDSAGKVELELEGIGPSDPHSHPPEEVLVVRPFGRKGENFSMRDFDRGAMQFHFGIQPVEVVGEDADEDGDGVVNEVTVAEMTVLHIFDVTNPRPRVEPLGAAGHAGARVFRQIGCDGCHRPVMKTRSRFLPLAFPEVAERPGDNVYALIELTTAGFRPVPGEDGVFVPLFGDLKRHRMGPRLAESFELAEIPNDEFTTARLWGVADTAPYLHDGRATTLFDAIEMHGGEAQAVRDAFLALPPHKQQAVLRFLGKLRTPVDPNLDLLQ